MSEGLTDKQKLGIAVAIGAGVCVGATGIIVYQRLSEVIWESRVCFRVERYYCLPETVRGKI